MNNEAALISDLSAPIRSFRLFAIEQLLQIGSSEAALQGLLQQQKTEDDPECQLLLEHAVATVQGRLSKTSGTAPELEITPETFIQEYTRRDDHARLAFLGALPQRSLKSLAPQVPSLFASERNRLIGAAMIRVFGRVWPRENLRDLVPHLRSKYLSVRTAVLEVFIKHAPELLTRDLPKLLISPDARTRALAVRGLAAVDPEEARNHLEALFELPQMEAKVAALQNSVYFPFEQVKPLLLKLVTLEQDLDFIGRVGMFLENNPDPEVPFRLWEIAEQSSPEKKKLLFEIQKRACRNIKESGILQDRFPDYIRELESWITKRAAKRWVQDMIDRLEATEESPAELKAHAEKNLAIPLVRSVFESALDWPIPDAVKGRMRELLADQHGIAPKPEATEVSGNSPPPPATPMAAATPSPSPVHAAGEGSPAPVPFDACIPDDKIRIMSNWGPEDADVAGTHLQALLANSETPQHLVAVALKAATRIGLKGFIEFARRELKSKSPQVACASLDYLGTVDADWLLPYLGKFLHSDNLRLKAAALKLLQKSDPGQAISVQKAMLADKNPEQQKAALACMIHFDFKLVRDALFQFITTKPPEDLIERSLCFFKANPELDNLYLLYKLEKTLPASQAKLAREIRLENEKLLTEVGQIDVRDPKSQEEALAARFAEERARTQAPSPFNLKNMREPTFKEAFSDYLHDLRYHLSEKSTAELARSVLTSIQRFGSRHPSIVGVSLLVIITFWVLLGWEASAPAPATDRGASTLSQPITVPGTILRAERTGVLLKGKDGRTYAVAAPHDRDFSEIAVGLEVKITLIPMRVGPDQVVKSQFVTVETP